MASLTKAATFFLVICMHYSNARLLHAIAKPFDAKAHHLSISQKVTIKNGGDDIAKGTRGLARPRAPTTQISKGEFRELLTGNAHDKKIDRVVKEGSEMVESTSSHHVALLKGKHIKISEKSSLSQDHGKETVTNIKNDDIVVMDYQPPHRKTPLHNK